MNAHVDGAVSIEAVGSSEPWFESASESGPLDQRAYRWLRAQNVSLETITLPCPIRSARVVFDGEPPRYEPNTLGVFAYILPVLDGGLIDTAAWQPKTGQLAARWGRAYALGQGQLGINEIGTTGRAMPIWRTPWGWLRNDRCGLVIVDHGLAAHRLAGVVLKAETSSHAADLTRRLRVLPPTVLIKNESLAA